MIVINDLSFSRGKTNILNQINYRFEYNSINLIYGPSGCGKTTLLRLIAGLETPESGKITFEDQIFSNDDFVLVPWKRNLNMLFQHDTLWPHMTIEKQIKEAACNNYDESFVNKIGEQLRIKQLLNRYPTGLSGGEARRCQLARVLATKPKILLLDEPLASLDADTAQTTAKMLKNILSNLDCISIIVSHYTKQLDFTDWNIIDFKDFTH
ncbi:MAG: ATP-binding cassette domain-containing protein [Candidatus Rifleibacteriota bacterium]